MQRDYRDAEVYSIRFQQCLTRAMTLIKMHFLSVLNTVAAEVGQRINAATSAGIGGKTGAGDLSETALNALLYTKFSSIEQMTRDLLLELEKRALTYPEEYGSLLQECFAAWFSARTQLLSPLLSEEVRRMAPQTTDLVRLVSALLPKRPNPLVDLRSSCPPWQSLDAIGLCVHPQRLCD